MTRTVPSTGAYCAVIISAFALVPNAFSQTADPKPPEAPKVEDETILLSPFVVDASKDDGYQAKNTLAGTRIRTDLKDVGASISVMTASFLKDTGSKNAEQLLVYSNNTEVAGQGGNFLGQGDGPFVTASALNKPVTNTRVRGLAEADNTRDFYLSDIPWDGYNVGRIDLQRGPNSILFGIGSPAGIVNSSLNPAAFQNAYKVENQIGSFGTIRFTGDFNQVLIKDELAIRVALLDDRTKYKQDPAFRNDKRVFAALEYDPSFLHFDSAKTKFRMNVERGHVTSNMPRYTPPIDTITPWWSRMGQATFNGPTLANNTVSQIDPVTGVLSNNQANPNIGPIGNRVYDGVVTTFNGAGVQGISYPSKVQLSPPTSSGVGQNGLQGIASTDFYAKQAGLVGASSGMWKAASMTDKSVFDFYNNLLEGPNKSEFNKFEAVSLALSQTFLNDKLGFEVAYDFQNARWGNDTAMSDDGSTITIDINKTLLDGTANPNVGRPMVVLGGGSAGVYREERTRETLRATAFAELNFAEILDKDSIVARIFGKNTFTGLYSKQTSKDQNEHGPRWFLSSLYTPNAAAGNVGQASRDDILLVYVGDSMQTAASPSGLGFQGLKTVIHPTSGSNINVWDPTLKGGAGDWSNNNPDPKKRQSLTVVNSDDESDAGKTYTGGAKSKDVVTSDAIVWQGYWLDNILVPMVGIRRDKLVSQGAPAPGMPGVGGVADINSNTWVLPNANDPTKSLTYLDTTGTSKTYSILTHLPKSLRSKLPGNTDISLFWDQSENFRPESRRDVLGTALPSSTGKTKEYGFTVSTLNDRLSLKVVHYETTVLNADLNGALNGFYLIGANEWWGGDAVRRDSAPGAASFGTTSTGEKVTWAPQASSVTPGTDLASQSALDQTYVHEQAAFNDWWAHLAPANMQSAWEFVSTKDGVGNKDGNYGPSGMTLTGTTKSKGWEFELVANPMDGLDLSFNASKTTATRSDLAKSYGDWIVQRWKDLQGPMGDVRIWGGGTTGGGNPDTNTTRGKFQNETYAGFLFFNALQGADVPELSPWRYNVVGNYTFKKGILKGSNVGASYRWQQAKIAGFYSKASADPVTGLPIEVADLDRPVKGKSEDAVDAWVGYEWKFYKNMNWRIQFNVRNVFGNDKLLPNTIQPDGEIATYRISEPRTFTLTNTLKF
jgi:outer membrane receptor protein involved in Fe transport